MEIFIHLSGGSTLNNFMSHENAVITLQGQEVGVALSVSVTDCKVQCNVQQ